MSCIYITDPKWFSFLSINNITENVNFWRKDNRNFNLETDDFFYFKIKGAQYIAGRGQFISFENMTPEEAWQRYSINCGQSSRDEFNNSILELFPGTNIETVTLQCIELTNIQWLRNDQFLKINEELFPLQTQAYKKNFTPDQIETLNQNFEELINTTVEPPLINEEMEQEEQFSEGSIKISIHKKIERNNRLMRRVKNNRDWICDICDLEFIHSYGVNYIEGHHKIPLQQSGNVINTENDIVLLCANCHRAVHKIMFRYNEKDYQEIADDLRIILRN
jgi:hypothetical protein